MSKREKIFIVIFLIIVIVPIIINEINIRPKLNLINDVKKITKNIENYKLKQSGVAEEYIINNGYTIDGKKYDVKGKGVIFLDKKNSVFLNRDGMCAMKLPYSDKIMIQYEECPIYRVFNNIKSTVVSNGSGLYKAKTGYAYKGTNLSNFVFYNNSMWNIIGFYEGKIKLVRTSYDTFQYSNIDDLYSQMNTKYQDLLKDSLIITNNWDVETISSNKVVTKNTLKYKMGLLSISDYLGSQLKSYKIDNNQINIKSTTFLTKNTLLSADNLYLNSDGNIYSNKDDSVNFVYPVIVLSDKAVVNSGSGTKKDPYIIKEAN